KARSSTCGIRWSLMVFATRSRSALARSLISAELAPNSTLAAGATPAGGASRVSLGAGRDDLGSGSGAVACAAVVGGTTATGAAAGTLWAEAALAPRPNTASARLQATRNLVIKRLPFEGVLSGKNHIQGWRMPQPALSCARG